MYEAAVDGITVRQTPQEMKKNTADPRRSARASLAPAFLNAKQAAELLGVSERKFIQLRAAGVVPPALELGPRALRWSRDELLAHIAATAPRVRLQGAPASIAAAKARLAGKELAE
jgi:predicted DNA-binding transcriptional regulator AlpA